MNRTYQALESFLDLAPWCLAVVVAMSALVWIILRVRARFRDDADPAGDAQRMLTHFRELQREGGLSEEEFRSIKGRLMDRIDGSPRAQDALPPDRTPPVPDFWEQDDTIPPTSPVGGVRKDEMTRYDRPTAKDI